MSLINDLRAKGVPFSADGDRLNIKTPKGVTTDTLKAQLTQSKPEILKVLAPKLVHANPTISPAKSKLKVYKLEIRGRSMTVLDPTGRSYEEASI